MAALVHGVVGSGLGIGFGDAVLGLSGAAIGGPKVRMTEHLSCAGFAVPPRRGR